MANQEHLAILSQGVDEWNKWRIDKWHIQVDLHNADLQGAALEEINFRGANLMQANLCSTNLTAANLENANLIRANLTGASLSRANLFKADLRGACLRQASLGGVDFRKANLSSVDLREAFLRETNFSGSNLTAADLRKANLREAILVGSTVTGVKISGSLVYGINIWDLKGEFEEQKDLVITPKTSSVITVDDVKVAQFLYLILNNEEIRGVINTLTSKSVLILGRFTLPERKAILDTLKNQLREFNLLPIVFDFDRPIDKDFTETIKTLAGLSYFVIADVTNPKSSPLELQATVPDYQIPFVPIIQEGEQPFAMMVDLQKKYNWVLNTVTYDSMETLIKVLKPLIIDPAMKKRQELRLIKAQEPEVISGKDYLEKGKS